MGIPIIVIDDAARNLNIIPTVVHANFISWATGRVWVLQQPPRRGSLGCRDRQNHPCCASSGSRGCRACLLCGTWACLGSRQQLGNRRTELADLGRLRGECDRLRGECGLGRSQLKRQLIEALGTRDTNLASG